MVDVLYYGDQVKKRGLSLLIGSGNDAVSVTNLTASGANIVLFTTGNGNPFGAFVPTIKISSNTALAEKRLAGLISTPEVFWKERALKKWKKSYSMRCWKLPVGGIIQRTRNMDIEKYPFSVMVLLYKIKEFRRQ